MKNLGLLIGSLLLTFVAVVGVAFAFTRKANAPIAPSDSVLVLGDARNTKGGSDAKVTITEFSDFQCPACKATEPLLADMYNSASDSVRLVFRHFPLRSIHKNAMQAAIAAEAAGVQGKFFEYHDVLFDKQTDWEAENDPTAKFESYANEIGLDTAKWKTDYANPELKAKVEKDEADGNALGVNSTPTIFVNNVRTDVSDLVTTVGQILQNE